MDIFRFNVIFDANSQSPVSISGAYPFPLRVQQGLSLITFALDPSSGAEFATNPIQWLQDHEPAAMPPWFVVHRQDALHFALWDFNSDPVETSHQFELSVFYEGHFFSPPDPSIVNDPPVG